MKTCGILKHDWVYDWVSKESPRRCCRKCGATDSLGRLARDLVKNRDANKIKEGSLD